VGVVCATADLLHATWPVAFGPISYLCCHLASKVVVVLGVMLSRFVCVCVRRISLGGKGNALYPVLSSL